MKRWFIALASVGVVAALLASAGCASSGSTGSTSDEDTSTVAEEVPELEGEWVQTNSDSEENYLTATIEGDTITVNWQFAESEDVEEGDWSITTALYWAGTYTAPEEAGSSYSWTSEGDRDQMDSAILAASADEKEFTYEDGVLSFELTYQGETSVITMERDELAGSDAGEDPEPQEIVESGYTISESGYVYYGITWKNPNTSYAIEFPTVQIVGRDEDGAIVFTEDQVMGTLLPGEEVSFGGLAGEGVDTATVEFSIVGEPDYAESDEEPVEHYSADSLNTVEDKYGETSFTGELATLVAEEDISQAWVSVILRDASGDIVAGYHSFADVAAEGGTAAFEVSAYDVPDYESYDVVAIPWN